MRIIKLLNGGQCQVAATNWAYPPHSQKLENQTIINKSRKMKSLYIMFFCLIASMAISQTVANFENLNIAEGSFDNDAGAAGAFQSGHISLPNAYDSVFDSWAGWAISATTDITTPGYQNQYSAIAGTGANGTKTYSVTYIYGSEVMNLTGNAKGGIVEGMYITNSTYAYLSMQDGDGFAKKFGGASGNDPDFFKITIKKYLNGEPGADSVEFYLADYRFANNSLDYIVDEWTWVDLSALGNADYLEFTLSSTDVGTFGINTPTYFCVDEVTTSDMPSATKETSESDKFDFWPNPATDFLTFQWDGSKDATACLSNIYGEKILQYRLVSGQNRIDISDLTPGVFTLQLSHGDQVQTQVFIKN
jgi:hypothetical protein